jgi:hypothetical protein
MSIQHCSLIDFSSRFPQHVFLPPSSRPELDIRFKTALSLERRAPPLAQLHPGPSMRGLWCPLALHLGTLSAVVCIIPVFVLRYRC